MIQIPIVRVLAFCSAFVALAGSAPAQGLVRGRLHIVWDGASGGAEADYYLLPVEGGAATRLRAPASLEAAGTLLALDRKVVEARLGGITPSPRQDPAPATADLLSVRLLEPDAADGTEPLAVSAPGPPQILDFVTVLCRFADDASTPFGVGDVEVVHGGTYPGVRYHYREMSWNPAVMAGSRVVGWYTMPLPRSSYVSASGTNLGAVAQDCASLAQGDVDFTAFHGINLQLNGALHTRPTAPYDLLSFGGSWTLTLNGVTRSWGATWLSGIHARNYVVVQHEIGHAAGWPHSSGEYGQEYDSAWDLMSRGYLRFENPWGWLSVHTIASHKDHVGWIPPDRVLAPGPVTVTSERISRTSNPPATGYLLGRVPADPDIIGEWYAIEARMPNGVDTPLPSSAILIHRVRFGIRSYVVDASVNGNPNDQGAIWSPGEEFVDAEAGVSVRVDAAAADGFDVTITRGWRLDVTILGQGEVAISAAGVPLESCATSCVRVFGERGMTVHLEATADSGRALLGWTGACTGLEPCDLPLLAHAAVVARFGTSPAFRSTTLANGTMGTYYADSLEIDPGGGAPVWSVALGTLPPGLLLNASNGRVTGVPSAAGQYAFTLKATSGPFEITQAVTIEVAKPVLSLDGVIQALLGASALTIDQARFLDLLGNGNGQLDVGDVRAWLIDASYLTPAQRASATSLIGPRGRTP